MEISVFGLGYVGCVSLGCLAQDGHNVIGVDINKEKVNLINQGKPTIIEKSIDKIIKDQYKNGRVKATDNYKEAVLATDISIICVGTPSTEQGHLNLEHIHNVGEQIGESLKEKRTFHTVVIRSTVLPGTNLKVGEIIEKISSKKRNIDFGVVSNPEFLREGSAVKDYYNPAITVLGSDSEKSLEIVKKMYRNINCPIEETDIEVAEIIKYVNNSFHALKIAFANEIGNICKKLGIDSFKLMDLFCKDDKLNISPNYFKPGFAYGGSCLPKDLRALKTLSHDNYLVSPVIQSIEKSNDIQKDMAFNVIASKNNKNIGIIGLSFKAGTDDLRYSPTVELVEKLLGKGYHLKIYDENVYISKLTGTNKAYIDKHIPHLSGLITDDLNAVVEGSDVLVVSHNYEILPGLLKNYPEKVIVDLVGIKDVLSNQNYEGICW
ncbi:UDP-glucose/GDP-mannose dehydrogenase family protein [bacterium]|nr:UDP-glucose/GDP-mannose dehydrogenase family protein [bacterium]